MPTWIALVGCSVPPDAEPAASEPEPSVDTTPAAEEESSPYIYEAEDSAMLLTMEAVEAGIESGMAVIQRMEPESMHALYEDSRSLGDTDCPYYYDYYYDSYGRYYWLDSCTTGSGTSFSGQGISSSAEPYMDDDTGYYYYGLSYFSGDARIVREDGSIFEGSGYSYWYDRGLVTYGYRYWYWYTYGDFRWEGPEAEGTWLEDGLSIILYLYAGHYPTYPGSFITYDASISGITGDINTIVIDDLYLYDESMGSACPGEPSGTISVRDADGGWYDAVFDGPYYWGGAVFPAACDGCGKVYYRGEEVGEVCPDFSSLLAWEAAPWDL